MNDYLQLLRDIKKDGSNFVGRNGEVRGLFHQSMSMDLQFGFPLLSTKRMTLKTILYELLGFIRGDDSYIRDNTKIWDKWEGVLPYTHLAKLPSIIREIESNPFSRRLVLSHWEDPWIFGNLDGFALPTCHFACVFNVQPDNLGQPYKLNLSFFMRSSDVFIGLPFNIASYAAMLEIVAKYTGLIPGTLGYTGVDCHIYTQHLELVDIQVMRKPQYYLPRLRIKNKPLMQLEPEDFIINNYNPHPAIKAEVVA